jgi:hypothetical protein
MQRIVVASITAALTLVLAGCASTSAVPVAGAGSTRPATATRLPNVRSLLLSISDLPTGWTVDNSSNAAGSLSCVPGSLAHGAEADADASFERGGGLPVLEESIGFFASAPPVFAVAVKALNACKTFTTTGGGRSHRGTLGAMSFPSYGDQSAAYDANLTVQGLNVNEGLVLVRKGGYIALVVLGDVGSLGSLDISMLEGFVTQAVAKISAAG